jgi:signal transduction histidine kinase
VIAFALVVAAATLVAGMAGAATLRLLPTLRLQLAGLAMIAVALPLVAVAISGAVMFDSDHDLTLLIVASAASFAAIGGALLIARGTTADIERLRAASRRFASGDLASRAPALRPAELAELAESFNDMAASLERLFDARRQLVAWASHDLRTPLASLQAMLEAIEDGLVEPERYLPQLREQVRALSMLVDDLFELARIDAGNLTLELTDVQLDPLVESSIRVVEPEARVRHVRLVTHLAESPSVRCAPEKVERVLYNLLTNALRHTPTDGSVAIRVESLEREVQVTVEDTGTGFDPAAPPKNGLGLAIARGLVQLQDGRLWQENRLDGGARVSFTLPTAGPR